jgi:hypothetical protein
MSEKDDDTSGANDHHELQGVPDAKCRRLPEIDW